MAKIKLLAVLSLDGYMLEDSGNGPDYPAMLRNEIKGLKSQAAFLLDEYSSLTLISEWKKNGCASCSYLMEANRRSFDILNCMMRMRLFDEITFYIVPRFIGNGQRLFQSDLPALQWECSATQKSKDGTVRLTYLLKEGCKKPQMFRK